MSDFIGTTIGLMKSIDGGKKAYLVRVNFHESGDNVVLKSVSGYSLGPMKGVEDLTITREEYDNRPRDHNNDKVEADWALSKCGWYSQCDDFDDFDEMCERAF